MAQYFTAGQPWLVCTQTTRGDTKRQLWVESIARHVGLSPVNGEGNQGFILNRYIFLTRIDDEFEPGLLST